MGVTDVGIWQSERVGLGTLPRLRSSIHEGVRGVVCATIGGVIGFIWLCCLAR